MPSPLVNFLKVSHPTTLCLSQVTIDPSVSSVITAMKELMGILNQSRLILVRVQKKKNALMYVFHSNRIPSMPDCKIKLVFKKRKVTFK